MTDPFAPLEFACGRRMPNRFMLSPLTNCQSHEDGRLSDAELRWLTMRAQGGFGLVSTCAAFVEPRGRGFPGQLGIASEDHVAGLTRLAAAIRREGALAIVQLHHAGQRAPAALIVDQPFGPSADAETGARAMTLGEVEQLAADFVEAAVRAERAGFDGVEVHGAHGYAVCAFLSPVSNRREDRYGGSAENRSRLLFDIVAGIRARCRPDFIVGVRLSPERFGLRLAEMREVAARLLREGRIDFLDLSLWDVAKEPEEPEFKGRTLAAQFAGLPRGAARLGAAGRIAGSPAVAALLASGYDFAVIGRGGILHHDFPDQVRADPQFHAQALPVSREYLRHEGLGEAFIGYMRQWKGFVADEATPPTPA